MEKVSNCCSERVQENTDICTRCGEHCEIILLGDERITLLGDERTPLDWYDDFVDYVQETMPNLYNEACEYADKKETETEHFQGERLREAGISQDEYENGDPYDEGSREWC